MADEGEKGSSMETWLDRPDHILRCVVPTAASGCFGLRHCCLPSICLLLHELRQADGENRGWHEAVYGAGPGAARALFQ